MFYTNVNLNSSLHTHNIHMQENGSVTLLVSVQESSTSGDMWIHSLKMKWVGDLFLQEIINLC